MAITSVPGATILATLSSERNNATCATCSAEVDLTASVLIKGGRIVGCRSCDWAAARTRAARTARAVDRSVAPLRALG